MTAGQAEFDFLDTLIDADGDTIAVDRLSDTVLIISRLLKCSRKKSHGILEKLKKDFDVYSNGFTTQLILAKDGKIVHNFEANGETYWHGHKYNPVNEWDFKDFIAGKKMRRERRKPAAVKQLALTCTETQFKRAAQLYYALKIGFDVKYKDYRRFYLVP